MSVEDDFAPNGQRQPRCRSGAEATSAGRGVGRPLRLEAPPALPTRTYAREGRLDLP